MSRILLANNPFGQIKPPAAVQQGFGVIGEGGGPVTFISNIVVLITVFGGLWTLFNILTAGLMVITAEGDPKKLGEMSSKISSSFIGLLVMVAAPLLTALIGLFFFGNATTFLKPQITTPGGL